nr:MAG TPA: hypothetical protein [Bacteriophage sp.]
MALWVNSIMDKRLSVCIHEAREGAVSTLSKSHAVD